MTQPEVEPLPAPSPPTMALRTYRFLRFGVVLVIVLLTVSILKETFKSDPDCLQGSISAYFYTPVQSVFVGALTVLGFTMVALWGKTWVEDACFNLAGLLAPVVAFVPTSESTDCRIVAATGEPVKTDAEKQQVLDASHAAINNNMSSYLLVVGIGLLVLLVVGVRAQMLKTPLVERPFTFWGPYVAAAAVWVFGICKFNQDGKTWLYENAHIWSAFLMFGLIVVAVFAVGYAKWKPDQKLETNKEPQLVWASTYGLLALTMSIGAALIHWWGWGSVEFEEHRTFWLETWMIAGLLVFWVLQSIDRWNDGAPPRTEEEKEQRAALQEQVASAS